MYKRVDPLAEGCGFVSLFGSIDVIQPLITHAFFFFFASCLNIVLNVELALVYANFCVLSIGVTVQNVNTEQSIHLHLIDIHVV